MKKCVLSECLEKFSKVKIGIVGDFCLDAYWHLNEEKSEISVETGLPTRAVESQSYFPGGAGNVAANIKALGAQKISLFGVLGRDPFGQQLRSLLSESAYCTDGLLTQDENWSTHCYIKPQVDGVEQNRIDFGNMNQLSLQTCANLLKLIEKKLPELDLVIINQQVMKGIHTQQFIDGLNRIINIYKDKIFLIDSRDVSDKYPGCWHKMNDIEAARVCGEQYNPGDVVPLDRLDTIIVKLSEKWETPFFITRGDRGCIAVVDGQKSHLPGVLLSDPIDTVGAGDAMLAGISMTLASGMNPELAVEVGNLTSAVCIKKLQQTGTATREEVSELAERANYVFNPDKAVNFRSAEYFEGSEIESVESFGSDFEIEHIIFDHDGTLSVLREGWEQVMEPVMMEAILGDWLKTADENLFNRVQERVRKFIDDSTGIQTLIQMQGLVKLVKEFGLVPESQILDEHGYKKIYNDRLMLLVDERMDKVKKGELTPEDFAIKGAHEFLKFCHQKGIRLYLASGTDEEDVIIEAKAMGYADLFESRIYGAVGDVTKEAKRIVMDRIIQDIGTENSNKVMAIGDGPVEIREVRKRGGFAVGIASDEVRRFGLNQQKRTRLIRAGAHAIISDYSQLNILGEFLHINKESVCHTHS